MVKAYLGTSTQTPSAIKTGVAKMLSITADLKTAIDAGDEAKVKVTGPQLEDARIIGGKPIRVR